MLGHKGVHGTHGVSHIKVPQWLWLHTPDRSPQSHYACADTRTQKVFDSVVLCSNPTMSSISEVLYEPRWDKKVVTQVCCRCSTGSY